MLHYLQHLRGSFVAEGATLIPAAGVVKGMLVQMRTGALHGVDLALCDAYRWSKVLLITHHSQLLTAYCPLPTAHCLLPTAHCLQPTAHSLLPTAHSLYCPLPTAHCCLQPTAHRCLQPSAFCCLLPAAYCLLPTAYCLLPTAYCLLPTARYLLPATYHPLPTPCPPPKGAAALAGPVDPRAFHRALRSVRRAADGQTRRPGSSGRVRADPPRLDPTAGGARALAHRVAAL